MQQEVENICKQEMAIVERDSTMTDASVDSLLNFKDDIFFEKMTKLCPILSSAIRGATGVTETK